MAAQRLSKTFLTPDRGSAKLTAPSNTGISHSITSGTEALGNENRGTPVFGVSRFSVFLTGPLLCTALSGTPYEASCMAPTPLRLARLKQGKTLQEVSTPAAISISKLSLLERGLRPTEAELQRLSGVLGIPVAELTREPAHV
jgi:hypothetical protein